MTTTGLTPAAASVTIQQATYQMTIFLPNRLQRAWVRKAFPNCHSALLASLLLGNLLFLPSGCLVQQLNPPPAGAQGSRRPANIPSLALGATTRLNLPGNTAEESTTATGTQHDTQQSFPMPRASTSHHEKEPLTARWHDTDPPMENTANLESEASESDRSSCSEDDQSDHQQPQPMHLDLPSSSSQQTITIDLLSTAFSLDPATLTNPAASQTSGKGGHRTAHQSSRADILASCSARLGIPSSHLQLFRLEEVASTEGPQRPASSAQCSRSNAYALAINSSGDTLRRRVAFYATHLAFNLCGSKKDRASIAQQPEEIR